MISHSFTHTKYFMCMVSVLSPEIIMNLNMALSLLVYIFFSEIRMNNGDSIPYVKYTAASLYKLTISHAINKVHCTKKE
jgi:hypothetical protein